MKPLINKATGLRRRERRFESCRGHPPLTCSSSFLPPRCDLAVEQSVEQGLVRCPHACTATPRTRVHRDLPSGSFRAVMPAGIDPLTGRRRALRETTLTLPEAEKALTRLQRQVDKQQHPKSAITVREA